MDRIHEFYQNIIYKSKVCFSPSISVCAFKYQRLIIILKFHTIFNSTFTLHTLKPFFLARHFYGYTKTKWETCNFACFVCVLGELKTPFNIITFHKSTPLKIQHFRCTYRERENGEISLKQSVTCRHIDQTK